MSTLAAMNEQPQDVKVRALTAEHVSRSFGAVAALSDASISVRSGEVVGLVGDNGAGKSTLIKILSGGLPPNSGRILLDGQEVEMRRPADALEAGIETVYQDLALVDTMSAFENVYLGREPIATNPLYRLLRFVDDRDMRAQTRKVLDSLNVKVPSINATVKSMSGGQRQCLAIARAILWGRRIVILDEPTAALGVQESEQVLDVIRRLKDHNVGVIMVTHNMQQVVDVVDRVTVMRLGRTIANRVVAESSAEEIVGLITGAVPPDIGENDAGLPPSSNNTEHGLTDDTRTPEQLTDAGDKR